MANTQSQYPVWTAMAQNYLSIMASSVSSECAFSQGGLTITKHRNRLHGNVVEALQIIKCSLRSDLIFREDVLPTSSPDFAHSNAGLMSEYTEHGNIAAREEAAPDQVLTGWDVALLGEELDDEIDDEESQEEPVEDIFAGIE